MSELLISPAPIATPAAPQNGNAHALGQSDATARTGDGVRADAESHAGSPFASVLKSEMGKKEAPAADSASSESASAEVADGIGATATPIDFSALFQFLGANPNGTTSTAAPLVATTEESTEFSQESGLPALQANAETDSTQILAAVPGTPAAILEASPRQRNLETKDESFASIDPKSDRPVQTSGKIPFDAAINADSDRMNGEQKSSELASGDFHALIERAATGESRATGPGGISPTSPGNAPSSSPNLRIDTPLGQTGWHDEMGQKLTWMIGNNRQQADLVLTPPQLGRIEVSLMMNGDQATAIFTSANPAVREALESSLHRLREVLADAGVSLGQTQVGSESPQHSSRKDNADSGMNDSMRYASPTIPLPGPDAVARTTGGGRSMIDIFA
jgi:flagellar hook-length control protein FliK